ncbi:MAG: hypothetical protein Q9162_001795 [Coniocarpon cinnabarinum]
MASDPHGSSAKIVNPATPTATKTKVEIRVPFSSDHHRCILIDVPYREQIAVGIPSNHYRDKKYPKDLWHQKEWLFSNGDSRRTDIPIKDRKYDVRFRRHLTLMSVLDSLREHAPIEAKSFIEAYEHEDEHHHKSDRIYVTLTLQSQAQTTRIFNAQMGNDLRATMCCGNSPEKKFESRLGITYVD